MLSQTFERPKDRELALVGGERMLPTVSVIVPAYNASATLGACLDAIAASSGLTHEVIVVDDASTDATAAIAAQHGVRVVRLERQSGAAVARNVGAAQASAAILFFTDADVIVTPDAMARAVQLLGEQPDVHAVFGSYTAGTIHTNFCSVYKNLVHHVTHQAARPEASTFWTAAGAIRAQAFWAVGGFDPADTHSADVEDIALGYRLKKAGYRVRLDRDLQVTHAKYYNMVSLIRSDVVHRAIPWTRLMLRERRYQRDLNTSGHGMLSAATVFLLGPTLLCSIFSPIFYIFALMIALIYLVLNRQLFMSFAAHSPRFLLPAIAMTALYYLYATVGVAVGLLLYLFAASRRRLGSRRSEPVRT